GAVGGAANHLAEGQRVTRAVRPRDLGHGNRGILQVNTLSRLRKQARVAGAADVVGDAEGRINPQAAPIDNGAALGIWRVIGPADDLVRGRVGGRRADVRGDGGLGSGDHGRVRAAAPAGVRAGVDLLDGEIVSRHAGAHRLVHWA